MLPAARRSCSLCFEEVRRSEAPLALYWRENEESRTLRQRHRCMPSAANDCRNAGSMLSMTDCCAKRLTTTSPRSGWIARKRRRAKREREEERGQEERVRVRGLADLEGLQLGECQSGLVSDDLHARCGQGRGGGQRSEGALPALSAAAAVLPSPSALHSTRVDQTLHFLGELRHLREEVLDGPLQGLHRVRFGRRVLLQSE